MKFSRRILLLVLIIIPGLSAAQPNPLPDTNHLQQQTALKNYDSIFNGFHHNLRLLNFEGSPVARPAIVKNQHSREVSFYLISGMLLLLGFIRFFYSRYFSNLFRVFFNSSLRQSQLTDQLLQAKLPSLFYNTFFILAAGTFAYLLLLQFGWIKPGMAWWKLWPACILVISIIYGIKYSTLKFTGWITSYKEAADSYIFIVFLINKIIGILLVPAIVIMAFSKPALAHFIVYPAFIILGLLLLLRFIRSWAVLKGRLKVSRFHFFIYIAAIEIIPILLIYKGLLLYLNKSA